MTNSKSLPRCNSTNLKGNLDEVSGCSDSFEKIHDRISEDIKKIERSLNDQKISLFIEYHAGGGDYLRWELRRGSKVFRLYYRRCVLSADGSLHEREVRPLIDTTPETRVALHRHLDPFLLHAQRVAEANAREMAELWKILERELEATPFD